MRSIKRFIALVLSLSMMLTFSVCLAADESTTVITFSGSEAVIDGPDAAFADGVVTLSAAGVYCLTGTGENIQVAVSAPKDAEVTLLLDNCTLSHSSNTVLVAAGCDKLVLKLAENSVNTITAGVENADDALSFPAIRCKCDTQIKGSGTLKIVSLCGTALQVTKELKIKNGTLEITASGSGIRVKKDMDITGGSIAITCEGNGIHIGKEASETETDSEAASGTFTLTEGTVTINAAGDGIQSEMDLVITGSTVYITANGGASNAAAHTGDNFGGGWGGGRGGFGGGGRGGFGGYNDTASVTEESASAKGLKAGNQITISGGTITLDCSDDTIHANNTLQISGGTINAASGDDGLHADNDLTIDDGTITITNSYEGIEATHITINGGTVSVTSSDDGMNACGGSNSYGSWGGPSTNTGSDLPSLTINGGTIYVNAQGDGLDSNGDLIVNGGTVIVDGPSDSMNGALDSGSESGGQLIINGGTVLAVGASGMAESFGSSSTQCSFNASISFAGGAEITITAADGTVLMQHTSAKSGGSIVFSCPDLTEGDTVTVTCGKVVRNVTITRSTVNNGGWGGWGR